MARARKTWKLVLTSVILSILILVAFTAVFIRLIVPAYNITREQIYGILTKALPILIGLILIEIALVSSRRGDNDYRDSIDKLAPNAYDSPLYTSPIDDPAMKSGPTSNNLNISRKETAVREIIREVPVEVVKEVVKEVPVEVIKEVPVEVEVVKEVPVEVVKEVVKEVPVEVVKTVSVDEKPEPEIIIKNNYTPIEVIKEVEVIREVTKEVPVEVIKEIEVPVEVVKEVPVEVIKEVTKEVPVEVVKEVPAETAKEEEDDYLSFREALKDELDNAKKTGYPLTLVALSGDEKEKMEKTFDAPSFFDDGFTYAILPYTRKKDILRKARLSGASILEMDEKSSVDQMIKSISK